MRLYNSVCTECNKNRAEMHSSVVEDKQKPVSMKVKSRRSSCGVETVSSWQGSQGFQHHRKHIRSWPESGHGSSTKAGEVSAAGDGRRRTQSLSGDLVGQGTGALVNVHKPLVYSQRHSLKNKFQVLNTLGEGTYGKVKLATDKTTGQQVALKYIKKTKIQDEADQVRIRREIQILSSLRHDHIVNVREVFEKKDKIVLVMDYAPGGELYDYLNKMGRLTEDDARRIFRQIVSAVNYCHENGIVHRDLKLENIILDNDGNVKIADFGLSNYFREDSLLSTYCGSPLYASPEIVNGNPYYGPEVDVWSLGVILYTLVYGAMPFESSNVAILRQQISHGLYSEPASPSEAAGLIHHMLTVAPSRRATMADVLQHWWVNFNYALMPNNKAYQPATEPPDTALDLAADESINTAVPATYAKDIIPGHVSSDSDVELDFRQSNFSVGLKSETPKANNSQFSEATCQISVEHRPPDDIGHEPLSVPSGLSKLPPDVIEILLKGCSKKTLRALFSKEKAFVCDATCDVDKEISRDKEDENSTKHRDFVQNSHIMCQQEKRPSRGILKRRGKFSGGDSGCVINEDMARHEEITLHESDHESQKQLSPNSSCLFPTGDGTCALANRNVCCCHNCCHTVTSQSVLSSFPCHAGSQFLHQQKANHHYPISQQLLDSPSEHRLKEAVNHRVGCPSEDCTQTYTPDSAKCHISSECKSSNVSNQAVRLPKSILKNHKRHSLEGNIKRSSLDDNLKKLSLVNNLRRPSLGDNLRRPSLEDTFGKPDLEDNLKRMSISSYGSNSSVDMFDLSYDSADSGHVVHARRHCSLPEKGDNIGDIHFRVNQTV